MNVTVMMVAIMGVVNVAAMVVAAMGGDALVVILSKEGVVLVMVVLEVSMRRTLKVEV